MNALSALCEASAEAYDLATRGDFSASEALKSALAEAASPAAHAWRLALEAVRFTADGRGAPPYTVEAVAELAAYDDARHAAALVCAEAERFAFLSFDVAALARWCALHDEIEPVDGLSRRTAHLWLDVAEGRFDRAVAEARTLEADAAKAGRGAMVVDVAALRALALHATGEHDEAKSVSRRASRMARTEAFPQSEYLAHLVLARIRRHAGHPHLATRILEALSRVASAPWRAWLRVEIALSGALEIAGEAIFADDASATPAHRFAGDLVALLDTAERRDRPAFEAAVEALRTAAAPPLYRTELAELVAVLDPERQPIGSCAAWCRGETDDAPPVISGLLTRPGSAPADDSALAYVVARPSDRRRVPRLAFGLTSRLGLTVLPQSRRKQGRIEMLVSLLALELGADGIEDERCFERIYGFEYEVELHKGVFDVLVHRTREYLDDAGRIVRADGRIRLELLRSVLVADPRCTKPLPDSLLRIVAQHRGATAKEVAAVAGVSLRAAQAALRDLAETGACEAQRSGRSVHYVVEDTTFSEPTRNRLEQLR